MIVQTQFLYLCNRKKCVGASFLDTFYQLFNLKEKLYYFTWFIIVLSVGYNDINYIFVTCAFVTKFPC